METIMTRLEVITLVFTLFMQGSTSVQLHVQPSDVILVAPDESVTILCQAGVPITQCRITLPHTERAIDFSRPAQSSGAFNYHGKGLQAGDCGVRIPRVTEQLEGTVICAVNTKLEKQESTASARIEVAKGPTNVELRGVKDVSREGDTITASCVVSGARAPATITWYLGDDVITSGAGFTVTRVLSRKDDGRDLRCVAGNVTSARRLSVHFAPCDFEKFIGTNKFVVDRPTTVAVTLRANPEPTFRWLFGSSVVESDNGDSGKPGRFQAFPAVRAGADRWFAALRISPLMPGDHGLYLLEAKNTVGETKYYFFVRNSDTPRGFSSSTSVTVAVIVVAVICCTFLVIAATAVIRARLNLSHKDSASAGSSWNLIANNEEARKGKYTPVFNLEHGDEYISILSEPKVADFTEDNNKKRIDSESSSDTDTPAVDEDSRNDTESPADHSQVDVVLVEMGDDLMPPDARHFEGEETTEEAEDAGTPTEASRPTPTVSAEPNSRGDDSDEGEKAESQC